MSDASPRPHGRIIDVSALPEFAFGIRDPMYWGLASLVAIEGTMIALVLASGLYLHGQFELWPPVHITSASRRDGLCMLALLLLSCVPSALMNRAAIRERVFRARRWLLVLTLMGVGAVVIRYFEFRDVGFRWTTNAYASVFWAALVLHTLHLAAGVLENIVFLALLYRGPVERKFMVDLHVNGLYWYFVVAGWAAFDAFLYWESMLTGAGLR
jgi:heme/copper-type cytochrome/quinol oxidase subunit 3